MSNASTALVDADDACQHRQSVVEQALGRPLIGDSLPMRKLLSVVECVAMKDITVLVRGETGTGKELIASLLHAASRRASKPFVKFNCAALAPELAESQLFGHTKGAFTGAVTAQRGFFAAAHGGTLLLDEVGELGPNTQAALLRALQEGEIQPVGSTRPEKVDVRVVAATNRDLAAEVRAGRFREDLYYRLAVVDIVIPPLRERRADIPRLVEEFSARYTKQFGIKPVRMSPDLIERLTASPWPGNVRQLENTVARLIAMSRTGQIDTELFGQEQNHQEQNVDRVDHVDRVDAPAPEMPLTDQVQAFERAVLARTFAATGGNQSETARRLSLSRSTLIDKLKKYGIGRCIGDA